MPNPKGNPKGKGIKNAPKSKSEKKTMQDRAGLSIPPARILKFARRKYGTVLHLGPSAAIFAAAVLECTARSLFVSAYNRAMEEYKTGKLKLWDDSCLRLVPRHLNPSFNPNGDLHDLTRVLGVIPTQTPQMALARIVAKEHKEKKDIAIEARRAARAIRKHQISLEKQLKATAKAK